MPSKTSTGSNVSREAVTSVGRGPDAASRGWLRTSARLAVAPLFALSLLYVGTARWVRAAAVEGAAARVSVPTEPARQLALLPTHRIVTFYGNPRSARMGILGAVPPDSMLRWLRVQADAYRRADPSTPVLLGLHLVTVVAQQHAGQDGLYRARMPSSLVEQVASWAEPDSLLLFLDIQPGRSDVADEVRAYLDFLRRPRVHLALDPEFAVSPDERPGQVIGRIHAEDVNRVVRMLAELVEIHGLPPKVLVIHRFTERMIRGPERILLDPRVQIVIDMDGFGPPRLKRDSYRAFVAAQPVQFTGFKLFYQQDRPLMSPAQVVGLHPSPLFIVYQ